MAHPGLHARVSFVGYRDFSFKNRYESIDFTENLSRVKRFISGIEGKVQFELQDDKSDNYSELDWLE